MRTLENRIQALEDREMDADDDLRPWPGLEWLRFDDSNADVLTVQVLGPVEGERSEHMWDAIEWALEHSRGRRVVADLTRVTSFDQAGVAVLLMIARATHRRRDNFCVAIDSGSL